MSPAGTSPPQAAATGRTGVDWTGVAIAAAVGLAGGALGTTLTGLSPQTGAATGGAFGLAAAGALRGRAASTGSGLVWGLGGGFLLWIAVPAAAAVAGRAGSPMGGMLGTAQAHVPDLLACLLGVGAPVGVALGVRGEFRPHPEAFHRGRAVAAGGAAGLVAALIFSRWMYAGDFLPLTAGLGRRSTHFQDVMLHFALACLIGCSFGALFQREVRNLGSAMGWGMAYAMFWWLLGPLTLFPLALGHAPDWSAERAGQLFGPLVAHVFYGLMLGIIYSGTNAAWTRLFVDADPLNRRREGPGIRLARSIAWGAAAGLGGGLLALPLMLQTGMITRLAGLEPGLSLAAAIGLHLAGSTLIGSNYGLLFRGEATDAVMGSLWGSLLGLIAWYAGPLTLLPLLRTGECDWRAGTAAALLPLLVGHLLFGVVTANTFLAFERRFARRRAWQDRVPPPGGPGARPTAALCTFALGLGVLLPILLS